MTQIDPPLHSNYEGDLDDQLRGFLQTFRDEVTDPEPLSYPYLIQESIDRRVEGGKVYYIAGRGQILLPVEDRACLMTPADSIQSLLGRAGRRVQDGFAILLWTDVPGARTVAFPIARWQNGYTTIVEVVEAGVLAIVKALDESPVPLGDDRPRRRY